jgi:hypothetical protein
MVYVEQNSQNFSGLFAGCGFAKKTDGSESGSGSILR